MFAIALDPTHDGSPVDVDNEIHFWRIVAVSFYVLAIMIMVAGAVRYFRQQRALIRGTVLIGGIEVFVAAAAVIFAVLTVMATVIRYEIERGDGAR